MCPWFNLNFLTYISQEWLTRRHQAAVAIGRWSELQLGHCSQGDHAWNGVRAATPPQLRRKRRLSSILNGRQGGAGRVLRPQGGRRQRSSLRWRHLGRATSVEQLEKWRRVAALRSLLPIVPHPHAMRQVQEGKATSGLNANSLKWMEQKHKQKEVLWLSSKITYIINGF